MKSFIAILLILFFVCLSRQQAPVSVTSLYTEFSKVRAIYGLGPISTSGTIESQAQGYANSRCSGPLNVQGVAYYGRSLTSSGLLPNTYLISDANTTFYGSLNSWNCLTDSFITGKTANDIYFIRHVLVPTQVLGCSFLNPLPCTMNNANGYNFFCVFQTYSVNTTRPVPVSSCPGNTGTTAPPVATTAAPTVLATTSIPTTAAPTTKAPVSTTAPPTTKAPVSTTAPPATTAPPVATTAPPTGTPQATIRRWTEVHDYARDCVGVPRLIWDESLASDAKAWANRMATAGACSMYHSNATSTPSRNSTAQGENLCMTQSSAAFDEYTFIRTGTEGWYTESVNFTCSTNTCTLGPATYTTQLTTGMTITLNACGHYTAMIWRNSTRFGCAYSLCQDDVNSSTKRYYGACRYSPGGNIIMNGVKVHPLANNVTCTTCAVPPPTVAPALRALTGNTQSQNTQNTQTNSFFKSDSEIYVLAMTVFILVVVVSIFVIVLINFIKNRKSASGDDYQLLETKN